MNWLLSSQSLPAPMEVSILTPLLSVLACLTLPLRKLMAQSHGACPQLICCSHARFLTILQAVGAAPLVGPLLGASGTATVTAVGLRQAANAGPAPPPPQPVLPLALLATVVPVAPAAIYDSNNRPPKTARDLRRRSHKECCRYQWVYQCSFSRCLEHERCLRDIQRHYRSFHGALPAGSVFVCQARRARA